ncbi:MAG: hypothetical protein H6760_02825 [Candidatus Nomurabacteria bacterium]|nr:MAG: hypothetical protein H6760_02825 [Candidatus Nomurabacteria bacterium]
MFRPRHKNLSGPLLIVSIFILVVGLGILWKLYNANETVVNENAPALLQNTNAVNSSNNNFALQPEQEIPETVAPPAPKTSADAPQSQSACEVAEGEWIWQDGFCLPSTQSACLAFDGLWGPSGTTIPDGCSLWAEDGGNECSDSGDCIGRCIVQEGDIPQGDRTDDDLQNVTAHCTTRARVAGCLTELQGGVPTVLCQ